jgi:hypothetical protein
LQTRGNGFCSDGSVGQLYVEFAFEVFIARSSGDDALPHRE